MESRALMIGHTQGVWSSFCEQVGQHVGSLTYAQDWNEGRQKFIDDTDIDMVFVHVDSDENGATKFLQTLNSDGRLSLVPVIMAGSDFDEESIRHFLALRAFDIIVVPVINKDLIQAKVADAQRDGRPTILVVDDDEFVLDLIKSVLELERFRTLTASSGDQALEILSNHSDQVRVVITDFMMPGMNGRELMDQIHAQNHHIPIIMVTGQSGRFTPRDAIRAGADGYLTKPFHNKELIYALHRILRTFHPHSLSFRPLASPVRSQS